MIIDGSVCGGDFGSSVGDVAIGVVGTSRVFLVCVLMLVLL